MTYKWSYLLTRRAIYYYPHLPTSTAPVRALLSAKRVGSGFHQTQGIRTGNSYLFSEPLIESTHMAPPSQDSPEAQ